MLEQVSDLLVDLEGLDVIEPFQVDRFAHMPKVYYMRLRPHMRN